MQPAKNATRYGPSNEERQQRYFHEMAYKLQCERLEIFKSQDLENGQFDVTFDIEGKKLHAHSFILTSVSGYMNALLSDRWTQKDEVIKVESYSYDYFYQFLCYLYIGNCELTVDNIREMVDMAEFYGAPLLKKFCVRFLSVPRTMIITVENMEEMYDFSQKYSLKGFERQLYYFLATIFKCPNVDEIIKPEKFNAFKKPFIQFMFAVKKDMVYPDLINVKILWNRVQNGNFFKAVFQWAENQVTKHESSNDDSFNVEEAIKAELNDFLPHIEFWKMTYDFLINFVVEKGFFLSSDELEKFSCYFRVDCENEESFVKAVYELAEKQALKKQKMIPDGQSFSVADSIKADLAGIIPKIKFNKLKKSFLIDFVVANGILSEEQANCVFLIRIEITQKGNTITGVFDDNFGFRKKVERHTYPFNTRQGSNKKIRYSRLKFLRPSTPAALTKMKGVAWYLCLEEDGILTFKHHSIVQRSDYLISEMNSENEFLLYPRYLANLTASFNNI
uniref:BTB domain-containing protein n=1 Tax=Panagrolaimus davidi TaxID=227884 RepID=A0A914PMD8_9BILA